CSVQCTGIANAFLIKFDASGSAVWSKGVTDGSAYSSEYGYDVVQTPDGGYATVNLIGGKVSLVKYDASGAISWARSVTGFNSSKPYSLIHTGSGYVLAGTTTGGVSAYYDVMVASFDSSGNIPGCSSTICSDATTGSDSVPRSTSSAVFTYYDPSPGSSTGYASTVINLDWTTTIIVSGPSSAGFPVADENKPLDMPKLTPLNLRMAVRVDGSSIDTDGQSLELQYAIRRGEASCKDVSTSSYSIVTNATPIAYYDDASHSSGETITDDPNDPADGSRQMLPQTYQESNPFTNNVSPLYAGQDGIWQFSLVIDNSTLKGRDFCLRIATSGGSLLNAINVADVAYAPQMQQLMRGGEWFDRDGTTKHISL
ncbi:MAG TPA: hypothetical protein VFK03_03850, partial [Candidatus Saccharimonadales bacterium]|nr:hypothetical protein [Candidatus Saccharimonadales bacterium]